MLKDSRKNKFILLLAILISASIFVPTRDSNAESTLIGQIATSAITNSVGWIFVIIRGILAGLIGVLGSGINSVLSIPVAGSSIVQNVWSLVRNFTNMFFIIILIIMAFGTIFSVSRFDFRSLIARFIIAALLINFSLVIGGLIIDITQSLSNVFLTAIGDVSNRVGHIFTIANRFDPRNGLIGSPTADLTVWQATIATFGDIAMLGIVFFALTVLFIMVLIRIPILWGLLIFSPVAWVTSILPSTSHINRMWWKYFMGWNMFLPIYLFFIYIAVYIGDPAKKDDLLASRGSDSIMGLVFDDIFFYVLICSILIYGAKLSMSGAMAAGAGSVMAGTWARGAATARWGRRLPGRAIGAAGGIAWRASGAEGVYKEAKDKFRREGFAGFEATEKNLGRFYRGERGRDEAAAWLGQKTGLAPGLAQKQLGNSIDAAKKTFQERKTGENELKAIMADPSADKGTKIAAAQRLQEEFGTALTADQVSDMVTALGGTNSELAARTLRQVKWGEMSTEDLRRFTDRQNPNFIATDRNIESTVLNSLIERNKATKEEISKAIELAKGTAQKTSLIRKSKEYLTDYASADDRKWLLGELANNTALGATGEQGNESRIELLKIMAKKQDKFFHDDIGDPIQSELSRYADMFENPTELKSFLDDVSKKNADNVATELMNRRMLKDDAGNAVTDTQEALKRVLSKLSVDEKLTQDKSQYLRPHFQQAIAADMSRNNNTLQNYLSNDKYASASGNIRDAQKTAREAIFIRQYYEPFVESAVKAHKILREIRGKTYSTLQALANDLSQAKEEIGDLKKIRGSYESLCRNNNILDVSAKAQLDNFDKSIDKLNQRMTQIADIKKPQNRPQGR